MKPATQLSGLNDIQIGLLRMFDRNIPDDDILEIRRVLVNYLSDKLLNEVDSVVIQKEISDLDYKNLESSDLRTKPRLSDE
jgi:hypothetical protein